MTSSEQLSPEHMEELNSSRISSELIGQRGYRTVGPEWRERLRDLGAPAWAVRSDDAFPGLVLPMYRVTGEYLGFQFKPAVPQAKPGTDKPAKYASLKGMGNRLDVHPAVARQVRDPAEPLWITEGIKKADSLATRGLAVVTLTGVWNWRNQEGSLGDWEDIPLKGRSVAVCFDADAPTNPQVRNAMIRLVGWLRSKGATAHYLAVPDMVGDIPVKGVDDYLAAGGTIELLRTTASERAPEAPGSRDASFTDAFLTDTVCDEVLRGQFLYARGLGWMRYDGSKWSTTDDSPLIEEIRGWAKASFEEAVEEYKRDQGREVKARMEGWRQILNSGRLKALASLARGPLHKEATDFDSHADLLNCPNGVVDLRTGELLDPSPDYLMTKVTGVPYDPEAVSEDFTAALGALPGDVHDWYQVRIGQAFTGHPPTDDMMIVQQGSGENGKSTLAVPLMRAAGSYYVLVSDRVILGNVDQHTTEMMDLMGSRYALMEETPEARQLNVQQLKKTVGTPQITARRMRQDPVTFDASHSLFVNTNFTPAVNEADHATWRRLALLKFPYTFRSRPEDVTGPMDRLGDPGLRDRCRLGHAPAMAALTWAVNGAVRWYQMSKSFPDKPETVKADTLLWRKEGDVVLRFAEERLEFGPDYVCGTSELYQAFGEWLQPQGHKLWSQSTLKSRMESHDHITLHRVQYSRSKAQGRFWWGVRLAPKEDGASGMHQGNLFSPNQSS